MVVQGAMGGQDPLALSENLGRLGFQEKWDLRANRRQCQGQLGDADIQADVAGEGGLVDLALLESKVPLARSGLQEKKENVEQTEKAGPPESQVDQARRGIVGSPVSH
eukprot:TRINITY_DN6689_c0_g1_i6.p3 TRINITY_DN6689_c0_g1~~TRINITY_DN6689_c0_g1_i6.p3  ORF type:complete len:108 (+),score=8.46 TRINITY_DN6689_c0_g1_i6:47-370(+)